MNIIDIIDNLQQKLNTAIVNDITQKPNNQFTPLDNERETYRFKMGLDTIDYMGYDYLKRTASADEAEFTNADISEFPTRKVVRYLNGIVEIVDSNVEGGIDLADETQIASPTNLTFSANVVFFIPLTTMSEAETMELVGTVRTIIDNAMKLNTYADFNGYNMSVAYSLGRTGERLIRKGVGDSITLDCTIQYGFVEGGINSTQIRIKYGNSIIYAPSKSLTRVSTQEANVDLTKDNNSAKNTTLSTCLTLTFTKPFQSADFDGEAAYYMLYGDLGKIYDIEISFINLTEKIPMVFNEVSITGENALNAGLSITMVEAMTGEQNG